MIYNLDKQHEKNKLHAIERIELLLDKNTFFEINSGVEHNCRYFGMENKEIPYDGVITGFGQINTRPVAIYAQDFTVQGGSLGKMHGKKIAELVEKAIDVKCPVIGINDSGGARIQEGVDALAGYGDIFTQNVKASGYIPQISIIAGPCAGGAVYSPGITDFVFTIDKISHMFITGPKVVKSVMFEDVTEEQLGGSQMHAVFSGVSHFRAETEKDCFSMVRRLLDYIPHFYDQDQVKDPVVFTDKKNRSIGSIIPSRSQSGYDVRKIIECIIDDNSFFEIHKEFAPNIVIGFSKITGITVGIIANQPSEMGGVLNCDASDKAARFIRYCDAFNIPLLTLVDIPGFLPGLDEERKGIIRHGAKLIYAYAESTVPKITIILRKAYGGAYIAMCSKNLGSDFIFAWPTAEIAVMGAEGAVQILFSKEIKNNPSLSIDELQKEYSSTYMNPKIAAKNGYITEIIEPSQTRDKVVTCMHLLMNKKALSITKKHGNIPL